MGESVKNFMIGIFVVIACALAVGTIMFLKPHVGNGKEILHVRFSNINGINVGTRVNFAGKPVGEVTAINVIKDARAQPTDSLGNVYFYELTLKVDSSVKVYNTDDISLQTSGLLGEKSVSIMPKSPPKGVTPKLVGKEPIYADSIDPLQMALHDLSDLSTDMSKTFRDITEWIEENGETLAGTIAEAGDTLASLHTTIDEINNDQLIQNVNDATLNFSSAMDQINTALADMQKNNVFLNLAIAMNHLKNTSRSVDITTRDLAEGKGTLGRLIKGDDLYLQMTSIFSKISTLMNDINNYGILFHLNKQWQRTRLQRVSLLNSLNTPQSFKSYFESEVDQINMSMSRLSMLLDKAQQYPEREQIMDSNAFKKDFAEFLRQSAELSNNLQLFNQQLVEASNDNCQPCDSDDP